MSLLNQEEAAREEEGDVTLHDKEEASDFTKLIISLHQQKRKSDA